MENQPNNDNVEDVQYTEVKDGVETHSNPVKQETPTNPIKNVPVINNPGMKLDKSGRPDMSKLSPQEISKYKQIGSALNPTDPNSILNYGQALQNKMAGFSDTFLNNVRAFDAGVIGGTITDLLANVNMIEIDPSQKPLLQRMLMTIPGV